MPFPMPVHRRFSPLRAACGAVLLAVAACATPAWAGEAGRAVFVSGDVRIGRAPVALNGVVQEGDEITTGRDGYIYVKTVDDGLLVLRPSSRARIAAYHIDRETPANTRVKLELLEGVARSVSGNGVKAARQNFRFNTPVAAIGVRGTDFTVFTDQETSNVTVLSGAIVVSGFGGSCQPGGAGPCEHPASRELAASQAGQMLQVRRGRAEPNVLPGGPLAPDAVTPPRGDEPGKGATTPVASAEPSLDPQKASNVLQQGLTVRTPVLPPEPPPVPPVQAATPEDPLVSAPAEQPVVSVPVETVPPPLPPSNLVWGRWAAVAGAAGTVDGTKLVAQGARLVGSNAYYSVYRDASTEYQMPQSGAAGFSLSQGEALVSTSGSLTPSAAALTNGQLNVDFGARTFTTGFDLTTGKDTFRLQAEGNLGSNGDMSAINRFTPASNMTVSGSLGTRNDAAYIFTTRLDERRTANGVTYWVK
ncbi:FecR family protein [Pseudoduganella lurida]|uniref:FecR family protein n=1 Tax=Pseudoduganella lurida TaxID=1036180 RepID=A0A562R5J1_9BURK|nr:FecR family protein [Pseudoduganella lurida]TWI64335.1 FecR family protein [Pseudoduganella lurida]